MGGDGDSGPSAFEEELDELWCGDDRSANPGGQATRSDAAGGGILKKRGRALSTIVHTVMFLTASVGFTIAFAMLGDEQPWALDIKATEEMLGIGKGQGGDAGESLDEWLTRLGGEHDAERLRLFVRMLYTCCAWSCLFVCTSIISITFLAPRNRPLVLVSQVVICVAASLFTHFFAVFLKGSRHRRTLHSLLLCNWVALALHIVDLYLRQRDKKRLADGKNTKPLQAKGPSPNSKDNSRHRVNNSSTSGKNKNNGSSKDPNNSVLANGNSPTSKDSNRTKQE